MMNYSLLTLKLIADPVLLFSPYLLLKAQQNLPRPRLKVSEIPVKARFMQIVSIN
jgi:hypothetical protein